MLKTVFLTIALSLCALASIANADVVAPASASSKIQSIYQLGAGDKLNVLVFGNQDLSGEFVVDGEGFVSLPLIGSTPAGGKTVGELTSIVEQKLSDGYLLSPKVSISVVSFRPYYILGEVMKPGEYQYVDDLNVVNAVARAQGYTYRAQKKRVFIKRSGSPEEREYPLDSSLLVLPGDTVRIGERHF